MELLRLLREHKGDSHQIISGITRPEVKRIGYNQPVIRNNPTITRPPAKSEGNGGKPPTSPR